jgi:hypothetical protein
MTTYGRPGVYVTESFQALQQSSAPPAISIPAFAAVHPRGPLTLQLITSPSQYQTLYGSFSDTSSSGSLLPYAVNDFFGNGGSSCYVLRVANTDATSASISLEDAADTDSGSGGALTLTATSPGVWAQKLSVTVSQVSSNSSTYFNLQISLTSGGGTSVVESFVNLSMDPSNSRYCLPILNSPVSGSQFVNATDNVTAYVSGTNDLVAVTAQPLTGGNDGSTAPVLGTVVPAALDQVPNQIMAVNLPGVSDVPTLNALIAWAGNDGDKIIVCDGPAPDLDAVGGSTYSNTVYNEYITMVQTGSPALSPSPFGTLYGPWRIVNDPSSSFGGATRYLPAGPAVLGRWQQNDTLVGPWQSPAGINYPVSALQMEANFTPTQLDALNLANVNVIRTVPGYGPRIMGDRTLATGYPDMYLPVQRSMMAIQYECSNLLQFAIFEPNGPTLWAQISSILNNYLNQLFQQGVFAGTTSSTSFQVICDATNNTPQSAQTGLVNVSILVALQSPAEWIQIDLTQNAALSAAS